MMMRPSNSGTATCVATSSGDRPSSDSAQSLRLVVRHSPCRIGTSSPASLRTSQPSSSPPAEAFAGRVPPAASTVVMSASYVPRCSMRSSGRVAQRGGEDRDAHAAGLVDRVGEGGDVRGVPGRELRPVEEDRDPRPDAPGACRRASERLALLLVGRNANPFGALRQAQGAFLSAGQGPRQGAPLGLLDGGLEALAGEQDGVGEERVQLAEVLRAALGEVAVRLGAGADRDRRLLHQRRVGRLLAAEDDHRLAERPDPLEPAAQVAGRTEDAGDDQVGRLEGRRHLLVRRPSRVGDHVVGAARAGRQQVGVGRGEQDDPWHGAA